MVLQWAAKQLFKYSLKSLNKYLNEEIDLEQLDIQLGSGTARLADIALNVGYINEQVKNAPFIIKHGTLKHVLVRLSGEIEIDGVDVAIAPRPYEQTGFKHPEPPSRGSSGSQNGNGNVGNEGGNCTYLGVSDGIWRIVQIIWNLLLSLRVKVVNVTISLEDAADGNITVRLPRLNYGCEDKPSRDSSLITKTVRFENASVTVGPDDDHGRNDVRVSGTVDISTPEAGPFSTISVECTIDPIRFRVTIAEVQRVVTMVAAFRNSRINAANESIYHDTSSFYDSSQHIERKPAENGGGKPGLPVIVDWMRKPKPSEPDLAASMDEFFECLDAWSQSGSGSGLWSLTRSAFGASSVLDVSKEIQIDYTINVKIPSVSATLLLDPEDGLELQLERFEMNSRISPSATNIDIGVQSLEVIHLSPSEAERRHYALLGKACLPRFPVSLHTLGKNRGIRILRTASLSSPRQGRNLAAALVTKHNHSTGFTETEVTISLQPLVVWLERDFAVKLGQKMGTLQVPSCAEAQEQVSGGSFKIKATIPCVRAIVSAAECSKPLLLAIDLAGGAFQQDAGTEVRRSFSVTDGSVYLVRSTSVGRVVTLPGKATVDVRVKDTNRGGAWIARKAWDSVAAQRSWELGGQDSDFAATTSVPAEAASSLVGDLRVSSSTNIDVQFTGLYFDFSSLENVEVFELLRVMFSGSSGTGPPQREASQMVFSLSCVRAGVFASVQPENASVQPSVRPGNAGKYDALDLKISRLEVVFVGALGGDADAFYLKVHHGDGEILGLESQRPAKVRLLSCKAETIGRGDGSGRNALASGTAGLTITFIYRPRTRQKQAESLFTGTLKGATLLAIGGQFEWMLAATRFVELCQAPFNGETMNHDGETTNHESESCRSSFVFDGHDIAVSYEPEGCNSVACVLAASALRVSSSEAGAPWTDQYDIWLKDLGLHLVDTTLRASAPQYYTTRELQHCHYVGVAKGPVVCASVKISNEDASWEVESAKSHLYFESCGDTTSSFGRLAADLQQIFVPEIQVDATDLHLRTMKGKSPESDPAEELQDVVATIGTSAEGLFEGVVENAFAVAKKVRTEVDICSYTEENTSASGIQAPDEINETATFIEDYYLSEQCTYSAQESQAAPSSSYGDDFEATGGWYGDSPINVLDAHVRADKSASSSSKHPKKTSNSGYPKSLGRVVLSGINIQWRLYGGLDWGEEGKQRASCMEVSLHGMNLQYDGFGPAGIYSSALVVEVENLRVYDRSADAPWTLVLGYYDKSSRPRESTSKALKLRMDTVRPNALGPREEYRATLSLLPISLRLDQGHKDFLTKFFAPPESDIPMSADGPSSPVSTESDDALLPYFQLFEMRAFTIRVDYVPRRIDLEALTNGDMLELVNLVSWKGVELHLKPVLVKGGHGWSNLLKTLFSEWLEDISKNQRNKFARGMGPIRPLCAVSAGAAKLVVFPAKQYKKDRRLLRGMRKGALAFLQSISLEALGLGANLAAGAHHVLVQTELALGGTSSKKDQRHRSQPSGTREGLQQAYESMAQGLEKSAISLVGNPVKVYQHGGSAGLAVASAIRNSPSALLAPASATADAVRQALLGVRNSLDPECKRE